MSATGTALLTGYLARPGIAPDRAEEVRSEIATRERVEAEEADFRRAREIDTPVAYTAFTAKHPGAPRASEAWDLGQRALEREEDEEFGDVLRSGAPERFKAYLEKRGSLQDLGFESTPERASRELDAMYHRPHFRISPEADASIRYLADRRAGPHHAAAQDLIIRALIAAEDPFGPLLQRVKASGGTVTAEITIEDPVDQPYADGALDFLRTGLGRVGFDVVTATAQPADIRFAIDRASPSGHFEGVERSEDEVRPERVFMRWVVGAQDVELYVSTPMFIQSSETITQQVVKRETARDIGGHFFFPW
jgi:hypothetical protein